MSQIWNQKDSSWPQFPCRRHGTIHPHKKTITHTSPLPPSGRYHSPPRGVILTIHHKPSAHCGRIAVHWTVQSRVPSRLLSVRGGVRLTLTPPNTSRQRDTREAEKLWKRESEERGGKIAPEEEYYTGKEKRGLMEGEGRRQWGKVQNGSSRFAPSLFFFSPSFLLTIHPFTYLFSVMCIYSHYFNSVSVCVWLQCLFHSTFDISLVARARGGRICGPRWTNLTIWPSLHASFFFAFDEVWMHLLPYKMT